MTIIIGYTLGIIVGSLIGFLLARRFFRDQQVIFWLVLTVGTLIRLYALGDAQLWYDEAFTYLVSKQDLGAMIRTLAGDVHPPLYYLLTWSVVHLGGYYEWALRLPSVIFSVAALWLTWQIGKKLGLPDRATLIGVAFMALCPTQIHYAQEARMYALLQAEVLAALLLLLHRRWWVASIVIFAGLYTHNYMLIYMVPLALIAIAGEMIRPVHYGGPSEWVLNEYKLPWRGPEDESQVKQLLVALIVPVLAWLPWAVVLVSQMQTVAQGYWIQPVTAGSVIYSVYMLFTGFSMPDQWQPVGVLVVMGTLVYALWRAGQQRPAGYGVLISLGLLPLFGAVGGSIVWKPVLLFRGLIGSGPALYLLIAWALTRIDVKKQYYAAFLTVPVLVSALLGYYLHAPGNKGHNADLVQMVRDQGQPGDIIYHVSDGSIVTWLAYGQDLTQYKMPSCDGTLGQLSERTRAGLGIQEVELSDLSFTRAWIVFSEGPTSAVCETDKGHALISGAELVELVQDDQFVESGVYLVVNQ